MEAGDELKFTIPNKFGENLCNKSEMSVSVHRQRSSLFSQDNAITASMKSHAHLQCVDDTKLLPMPTTTLYQEAALLL